MVLLLQRDRWAVCSGEEAAELTTTRTFNGYTGRAIEGWAAGIIFWM